ncbi:MAG: hypothetical protein J6V72_14145 [Kiritimatiellae bacterium]|nr:hypothetical protein [Kiritimatiellia bacterium]
MSEKEKPQTVDFRIVYTPSMRRIYFNRFMFSHADGVMCIRVWFQDELKRDGDQYAFVFADEDFKGCKSNIKNYLHKVLRDSSVKSMGAHSVDQCPSVQPIFDNARVMMCSRSGVRAEVYLGFFPLAMIVSNQPDETKWNEVPMDVALCSDLECHVDLLRKMVES